MRNDISVSRFAGKYFHPSLDLRVRLFHVLAMGGTVISLLVTVLGIVINAGIFNVMFSLLSTVLSYALLTYSQRSGRYQICYIITIIVIFLGLFPAFFFSAGGYHSGMPAFFVFAVAFTIFMLEGKKALLFSAAELFLYIAICLIAHFYPDTVQAFSNETEILADIIIGFVSVSVILGICMFLHFRMYNEQQRKLDEQNTLLAESNRSKTEFFANASHEMRTPLTVISVNVQTVADILSELSLKDDEARELLKSAQSEIMRLARMVGGILTLASMSELEDRQETNLSVLLQNGVEMLRLNLSRRGNEIETELEKDLYVFGNADLLVQVLINLLQNAGTFTENGVITVSAAKDKEWITVTVRDTGAGISSALLPHVFERGVSTGGTGFGLYLCKTVVESHGGKIWITSEPGTGTTVFYTLPVYAGQYGSGKQ
jgi:signal transduction histidine kinase